MDRYSRRGVGICQHALFGSGILSEQIKGRPARNGANFRAPAGRAERFGNECRPHRLGIGFGKPVMLIDQNLLRNAQREVIVPRCLAGNEIRHVVADADLRRGATDPKHFMPA